MKVIDLIQPKFSGFTCISDLLFVQNKDDQC